MEILGGAAGTAVGRTISELGPRRSEIGVFLQDLPAALNYVCSAGVALTT